MRLPDLTCVYGALSSRRACLRGEPLETTNLKMVVDAYNSAVSLYAVYDATGSPEWHEEANRSFVIVISLFNLLIDPPQFPLP